MKKMNPIPYGRQHITDADIEAVTKVLKEDFITQGPKIEKFEDKFSEYVGSKYAVAVANGTAALHLCALALGVNEKSNVITTPITFSASANCIRYCGGTVTFADVDPKTILLDPDKVEALLKSAPKGTFQGIIPVDFAGNPADMEAYRRLADEYDLWIIEDACHAPGGLFRDTQGSKQYCGNGNYADLAIFSFHPVKHITSGEGGMITTNNKDLYERLYTLRTHGITKTPELSQEQGGWYYDIEQLGFNYRLTDFQSALGISQLSKAPEELMRRHEIAQKYDNAFSGTSIQPVISHDNVAHAYHLYVVQVEQRRELYDFLRLHKIFPQIHYIPVYWLSYYQHLGYAKGGCPIAEAYYKKCISLPMYPTLKDREQNYVVDKILSFYNNS